MKIAVLNFDTAYGVFPAFMAGIFSLLFSTMPAPVTDLKGVRGAAVGHFFQDAFMTILSQETLSFCYWRICSKHSPPPRTT